MEENGDATTSTREEILRPSSTQPHLMSLRWRSQDDDNLTSAEVDINRRASTTLPSYKSVLGSIVRRS